MTASRVSTSYVYDRSINNLQKTYSNFARKEMKLSETNKFDSFTELGFDSRSLFKINQSFKDAEKYLKNCDLLSIRMESIDNSISYLLDITDEAYRAASLNESWRDYDALHQFGKQLSTKISNALNAQANGMYLFSGTQLDHKPLDRPLSEINFSREVLNNYIHSNEDFSKYYYQGDENILNANVSESVTIDYGICGNNEAFQELIASVGFFQYLDYSIPDDLKSILNLLQKTSTDLINLQKNHQYKMAFLANIKEEHETIKLHAMDSMEKLESRKGLAMYELLSESNKEQMILSAAQNSFSKISNLKTLGDH
ncbi:MAG: hypothetical protein OEY79_04565 [Anaplasmataceae bacterium]|nr:hypothetical protein [Anaplasmataceae bacterium]